jgi:hypothetical protein
MRRLTAFIPLLALALLPAPELPACGPFPPDDEPGFSGSGVLSLFSPWCVPDSLFTDLIDQADGLASGPYERETRDAEAVSLIHTDEWLSFLGWAEGKGPREELAGVLDAEDPAAEFNATIAPLLPREVPADRRTAVVRYLGLLGRAGAAVRGEQAAAWDYGDTDVPPRDWAGILRSAAAGAAGAAEPFLRARYAFQAVRAASLSGSPDRALELYKEHFASAGGSTLLRYRAMGYAARAWIQKGQPQTGFGMYVAIFDQCPTLSGQVLQSLRSMDVSDETFDRWTEALDSPHRRAVAAFTHALLDPHRDLLRYIEQIIRWEPASPHAVKLLMSTVRSIEAERLPRLLSGLAAPGKPLQQGMGIILPDWREEPSFDDARIKRVLQAVRQARAGGAVRYPGLWCAAEAHLLWLMGDGQAARAALAQGTGAAALSAMERGLLHAEDTLLGWSAAGEGSWQPRCADDLAFLDQVANDRHDGRPRETYLSLLAHQHLAAGDVARAALGFAAAGARYTAAFLLDIYGEPDDLLKLEAVLREPATQEDRLLGARHLYSAEDARYLAGIRLMRRGQFAEAAEAWKPLPAGYWKRTGDGPTGEAPLLHVGMSTENTLFDTEKGRKTLSRLDAAQKLAALKARLDGLRGRTGGKDRQAAADAAAALGSAWMSTPYLGYADVLWDGMMVYTLEFMDNDKWPFLLKDVRARAQAGYERFRGEYDHLANAAACFEEARSLETNREKAALYSLSAIECLEGYRYQGQYMENPTEEKGARAEQERKGFAKLYRDTAFYRTYARSFPEGCPGLGAYR